MRSEEDRCSKMREELLTLREELSKTYLAKDMLEQQKLETDGLISQIEKSKGDLSIIVAPCFRDFVSFEFNVALIELLFRRLGTGPGTRAIREIRCARGSDKIRNSL